ncbi:hypothetical protein [Mycolicibacterium grossiae]|uniref:hypothetical protein n=1 Tax=Mycolicibacterium grossiae TaxID=1552759 RepID=UPI0014797198|nr:hypothetical protein [Mycolicibacterium grossiae]
MATRVGALAIQNSVQDADDHAGIGLGVHGGSMHVATADPVDHGSPRRKLAV